MAFSQSARRSRIDLSSGELLAISRQISREFAPRFVKSGSDQAQAVSSKTLSFSSRELLAISEEISREYAPRAAKNYTNLTLLPIDPRRLYAYWHIAETHLPAEPKTRSGERIAVEEEPLTLRVFRHAEPAVKAADPPATERWFDIPIAAAQNRLEITLQGEMPLAGEKFDAAIGVRHGEHGFTALAYSNLAHVPCPLAKREDIRLPDSVTQFMLPFTAASSSIKVSTTQEL